jgi:hypothetical protein
VKRVGLFVFYDKSDAGLTQLLPFLAINDAFGPFGNMLINRRQPDAMQASWIRVSLCKTVSKCSVHSQTLNQGPKMPRYKTSLHRNGSEGNSLYLSITSCRHRGIVEIIFHSHDRCEKRASSPGLFNLRMCLLTIDWETGWAPKLFWICWW